MKKLIYCIICKEKTKYYDYDKFTQHHLSKHKINSKNYYDIYLKNDDDGICKTCKGPTTFKGFKYGYAQYCSNSCVLKNKDIKKIQTDVKMKNEIKIYGTIYLKTKEFKDKAKAKCIEKYGVDNFSKSKEFKDKAKAKCIEKYGVDNFSKSKEFRKIMENKGIFIPLNKKTNFEQYKLNVHKETRKWRKKLFDEWDGKDYYTGKKLLTDTKLFNNIMYRTIDHKISIYEGFLKNIEPIIIGHIDNLCITSRGNNSRKQHKGVM